jgi:hypothetical protein
MAETQMQFIGIKNSFNQVRVSLPQDRVWSYLGRLEERYLRCWRNSFYWPFLL